MNVGMLWAGLNLLRTGNVLGIKKEDKQTETDEQRRARLEEEYKREPGIVREYRIIDGWAVARIRTSIEGEELWRARRIEEPFCPEINAHADRHKTMDEFIGFVTPQEKE